MPDGTTAVLCKGSELSSEQRTGTHGDKWQHQQKLWSGGGEVGHGEVRKMCLSPPTTGIWQGKPDSQPGDGRGHVQKKLKKI